MGGIVVAIAVAAVLVWAGYLLSKGRATERAPEPTPMNQQAFLSDDELESGRLTRVLGVAVVVSAVLAITLPVYYLSESNRQANAEEAFHELDIEEGEKWYTNFSCYQCHGIDGGGGGATFTEARSGISTSWAAPSINDVFYRYSEDEIRYWIVFGRAGTPMPANGLEGGGGMTSQEVDQVIAFLRHIQIPQAEAVAEVEPAVTQALGRVAAGGDAVAEQLAELEAEKAAIQDAPTVFAVVGETPTLIRTALAGDGTCTDASAALAKQGCDVEGADADRDGLTDTAEATIADLFNLAAEATGTESLTIELDPTDAFTNRDAGGAPISDLAAIEARLVTLDTLVLNLRITSERQDVFLANVQRGIDFLEEAAEKQLWDVDFQQVADDAFDGNLADAERAVGLFNAYCARCHTAGYSAGSTFQRGQGSGAWGPALDGGRTLVQFPNPDDHIDFIIRGSENAVNFGINGLGRGWMPGFGQILSREDIELIVAYERSL